MLRVYSIPLHTQSLQHTITYSRVYSISLHAQSLHHTITYSESTAYHYILKSLQYFITYLRVYSIPLHTQESIAFHYMLSLQHTITYSRVYSISLHTQSTAYLTISSVHISLACCSQPDTLTQYCNKKAALHNENPVGLSATCCGAGI